MGKKREDYRDIINDISIWEEETKRKIEKFYAYKTKKEIEDIKKQINILKSKSK